MSSGFDHDSLTEAIYKELKKDILVGIYRPGQMLRQQEVAERLRVSRAPLREVLSQLASEGVVKRYPRRGYAVTSLAPSDIEEIFELRALIEERASRLATECRTNDDVARLRAIAAAMRKVQPTDPEQIALWSNLNSEFHDCLIAPSNREHFRQKARNLRSEVGIYVRAEIGLVGGVREAGLEHDLIVSAFASSDVDLVGRLTREHCEHTAQRLLEGLKRREPFSLAG